MSAVTMGWLTFYAQRGFKMFPVHAVTQSNGRLVCTCGDASCTRVAKHPVGMCAPRGVKDATGDLSVLFGWWNQVPWANIGLATGNGIAVVDIDPGKGGDASLAQLRAELGSQLDTPMRVATGGGGSHLFFRTDSPVRNQVDHLPGIDVRGEVGYVIAPPSQHGSGQYYKLELAEPDKPLSLPLLPTRFLSRHTALPAPVPGTGGNGKIRLGQRNDALVSFAGSLRRFSASPSVIEDVLRQVNAQVFDPPISADELRRTVASISKYEPAARPQVEFATATTLVAAAPAQVPWLVHGYLASGVMTELVGQPKAGKSTLMQGMLRAVLGVEPFLGLAGNHGPVLLLTEEHDVTLRQALIRNNLVNTHLHVLSRTNVRNASWPEVVEICAEKMTSIGAKLLVVDTLSSWALGSSDENSATDALRTLEPLMRVASKGAAVLTIRHQRKGGGDVVVSGRGSSAFAGASDIVLSLQHHPTRGCARVIESASRFHETYPKLVVELIQNRFVSLGDGKLIQVREEEAAVASNLPADPQSAVTMEVLQQGLEQSGHTLGKTKLKHVLDRLIGQGAVASSGAGVKNDPVKFWLSGSAAATAAIGGQAATAGGHS